MDEHYIEFTAVIGPIDKPHKLHTIEADGSVTGTVHGDLAGRLANAVWAVDHDADLSTHITTEPEMQTARVLAAERDRLRTVLRKLWGAWNDATLDDAESHRLDLTRDESRLLDHVVRSQGAPDDGSSEVTDG
jgi:hypothetical protein